VIGNRRILAVCPARGGSKGIPLKNLKLFRGEPLVAHVGHIVSVLPMIDRAVVSTDHDGIAKTAEASGLGAPFRRPAELSGDQVADAAVLAHALEEMERRDDVRYDIVVMLQPTSPLREPEHVEGAIRMLVDGDWDAVWSVSETDSKSHPLKQLTVEQERLDYYDPAGAEIIARQQLSPVYHRNGVAYALTRRCLVEIGSIKGPRTGAFVIDGEMISIDTMSDLERCETIHKRRSRHDAGPGL
jgi:CMP-N,N'-diacetyllegionaminic acid synthase